MAELTRQDKEIIARWLGDTTAKPIMEDTEIEASSSEITAFIADCKSCLLSAIDAGAM